MMRRSRSKDAFGRALAAFKLKHGISSDSQLDGLASDYRLKSVRDRLGEDEEIIQRFLTLVVDTVDALLGAAKLRARFDQEQRDFVKLREAIALVIRRRQELEPLAEFPTHLRSLEPMLKDFELFAHSEMAADCALMGGLLSESRKKRPDISMRIHFAQFMVSGMHAL